MGGDGGCFITRADCVKTKGYGFTKASGGRFTNSLGEMANYVQLVSEDRGLGVLERHRLRMSHCFLSQEPLRDPVVACRLGNLYNKEALIGGLLSKSLPQELDHIRQLKDVKHCLLTWRGGSEGERRIVCPLSMEDLDAGNSRAVLIWSTGAVAATKSLKELKCNECPVTGRTFQAVDLIPLVPDEADLETLRARLPVRKRKASQDMPGTSKDGSSKEANCAKDGGSGATGSSPIEDLSTKNIEASGRKRNKLLEALFCKDHTGSGLEGVRDAFGTPCYNRGAHL